MEINNTERVIVQLNTNITNINRLFKGIKLEVLVDFIYSDIKDIIVITNKVVVILDLNIIKKYVKNLNDVDSSNVMSSRLSQSKFYLKILGILYYIKDTNLSITMNIVKRVIKTTHIFNNVVLASHLYIIKVSSRLDMAIIWVNIWDSQNCIKAKMLINRYFIIS